MKKYKKILACLSLSFLMIAVGHAGDIDRVGTTAATQLLLPIGARSISMGNSAIASTQGVEAIHWNPAGIAASTNSEVMFSNTAYIADIKQNYLGATLASTGLGTFGFHIQSLDFGDIEETTVDEPDGTGRTYSPTFFVVGLTYSRFLTDRIIAGVTGKYISEEIMQTGGTAMAIDFGVQYIFNENFRFGVAMKNVGTKLQYDGRNLERQARIPGAGPNAENGYFRAIAQDSEIPSVFGFGLSYKYDLSEAANVRANAAFSNNNDYYDEILGGLEFGYNDMVFLRAGYNTVTDLDAESIYGFSAGAGIKYGIGDFNLYIDYAFRQVTDYFDNNNIFSLKLSY